MPTARKFQFSSVLVFSLLFTQISCVPVKKNIISLFQGRKAGLAGTSGFQDTAAFKELAPYLSHYIDYEPSTPDTDGVKGVGMLWGAGDSPCATSEMLSAFSSVAQTETPDIMLSFNEPDCDCAAGSQMSVSSAAQSWNKLLAPLGQKGTLLGSPSPCKQDGETFLAPFSQGIGYAWDITTTHIYKPTVDEVIAVTEYYVKKYKKPVWITEIACVQDELDWSPCTDQDAIDKFIQGVVDYFEGNQEVLAYSLIWDGAGLGNVWPLADADGKLTLSGQAYLKAIR